MKMLCMRAKRRSRKTGISKSRKILIDFDIFRNVEQETKKKEFVDNESEFQALLNVSYERKYRLTRVILLKSKYHSFRKSCDKNS